VELLEVAGLVLQDADDSRSHLDIQKDRDGDGIERLRISMDKRKSIRRLLC